MKTIPQRTCVSCKEKKNKNELIRIVCNKQGDISVDKLGKMEGRGAYICNKQECLENAIKTKALERALKTKIEEQIYNNIRGVIHE